MKRSVAIERMGPMPAYVYPARDAGSVFVCCGNGFYLATEYREGQGFHQKHNIWAVDADDSKKPTPTITSVTALQKSLSGNESNVPLLLLANDHFYLAELQPHVGPVQRHLPLNMTPQRLLYSHVLKCLVVAVRTSDNRPSLRFIDPLSGQDLSYPLNGTTKEPVDYVSGLGKVGDRIYCLEEWHFSTPSGHLYHYILVGTRGVDDGGRLLIISPKRERPQTSDKRATIKFWTKHKLHAPRDAAKQPVYSVTTSGRMIRATFGPMLVEYKLDEVDRKIEQVSTHDLGAPTWKLSIQPDTHRTVALVKGESVRALTAINQGDDGQILAVTHVETSSRPGIDMLEVAGAWDPSTSAPLASSSGNSIVLVSDQNCSLAGLWIPWDTPGRDCEVLFEADLPSSVRRLRLGRTLPAWSRERRKVKKYGLLPVSVHEDTQILGMGIDGSMQHFTLLDVSVWRFLRFIQNVAETSAELYPFTHVEFDDEELNDDATGCEFDPVPEMDRRLEMQVDGDLMQRCVDKRALEELIGRRGEWVGLFQEYLDGIDGGRWTTGWSAGAQDEEYQDQKEEVIGRKYFALAYDILEYFLVPVI